MLNKIKIPVAIQITIDDLGWHDGRDYTNIGKASRSGIPRDHVLSDYQFMNELGRALNQKILGKLCLADWDKDNLLRGEIGITDDPINWDRAHTIDMGQPLRLCARRSGTLRPQPQDYSRNLEGEWLHHGYVW